MPLSIRHAPRALLVLVAMFALAACDDEGTPQDSPDTSDATSADATPDTSSSDTTADTTPVEPTTLEACVRDVPPQGRVVEYLTLASQEPALRVRLARRVTDGMAVGETFALELAAFGLEEDGELKACIHDPAQLDYVWGHHNWNETATATDGDITWEVRLVIDFSGLDLAWTDTLEARGGAAPFGPLPLTATDCATDPPGDLNFCMRRPRSDH